MHSFIPLFIVQAAYQPIRWYESLSAIFSLFDPFKELLFLTRNPLSAQCPSKLVC